MNEIIVAKANDPVLGHQVLRGMFRLRYRVFHQRLGWKVECHNGIERDAFDDLDPIYMVARNKQKEVEGCWRMLPTTGAYMLRNTFPQLLAGDQVPAAEDVWELSRFAVALPETDKSAQGTLNSVTFKMIRSVFDFAEQHNIRQYVTVTSVALERLLRQLGLPITRFGDKKAQRIGKVLSVACKVDINDQFRAVVYPSQNARKSWQSAA